LTETTLLYALRSRQQSWYNSNGPPLTCRFIETREG